MRVLFAFVCLASVTGFRHRSTGRKGNLTAAQSSDTHPVLILNHPSLKGGDCDQLSNIVIGGHEVGKAAVLLCRFWPAQFGEFPVDDAQTIVDLFNEGQALWDKIQELLKDGNSPFCWKKLGLRPLLTQANVQGKLEMNATEVDSMSSNCEMDILGKCYGSCPSGMDSASISGSFSPVCSSVCIQSGHDTPCGFGCSTSAGTCLQTLMDQVSVVANSVGRVASYLSGNPLIHQVVDQVLRVVDFAIDVVFDVVAVARHVWKEWPREQVELGIIVSLLMFVVEHAKTIGKDLLQLDEMFGETMEMILELIDAEFNWAEIDLEFIADTVLKHGMTILGAANEFAEAFVFPACEVVSNTNPDYDCTGTGMTECGDWDYWGLGCSGDKDRGGPCEYNYKFGDVLLDHSCRCRDETVPAPAPCLEYGYDYPGSDIHRGTPWTRSSAESCQQECQQHSDCQFFTYNYVNPIWNCFLKNSSAGRVPSDSHTSGPASC